jgi:hypothetical protein
LVCLPWLIPDGDERRLREQERCMSILGEERLREKTMLGVLREVAAKGSGVWRVEEMKERRKTF